MERYRAMVETLERALPDVDIEQARADLRALLGSIRVVGDEQGIRFEAELRATQLALLRAAGGSANNVVAGARFRLIARPSLRSRALTAAARLPASRFPTTVVTAIG